MKTVILISTTNSIEGATIERYIDIVSTNVVVGTNFFSDFGASLTDIFGGISDTYQSKLQEIYKVGIDKLKMKASNLGANAILGLSIDFDEISGKGKSMFMISAIGTAVKLQLKNESSVKETKSDFVIERENLDREIQKRVISMNLKENILPSSEDWNFLLNSPINEISSKLLSVYFEEKKEYQNGLTVRNELITTNVPNYFKALDENIAIEILYSNILNEPKIVTKLIDSINLFSAQHLLELLKNENISIVIDCLKANKNFYSENDFILMSDMLKLFDNLKDLGKIDVVKNVLGKAKEKYFCPKGHSNDHGVVYCTTTECGQNIKGLTKYQVGQIEAFRIKVESLRTLLRT